MMEKNYDVYGNGQMFGHFVVAYCRDKNFDIDEFFTAIKQESSIFFSGMADGIGCVRDTRVVFDMNTTPEK